MASLLASLPPGSVQAEPFPHLVLADALPDTLCARLTAEYPPPHHIAGRPRTGDNERFSWPASRSLVDARLPPCWRALIRFHTSQFFLDQVLALFRAPLRRLYPALEDELGPCDTWRAGLRGRDDFDGADVLLDAQICLNTPALDASSARRGEAPPRSSEDEPLRGSSGARRGEAPPRSSEDEPLRGSSGARRGEAPPHFLSTVRGFHVDRADKLFSGLFYMRMPDDRAAGGSLQIARFRARPRFRDYEIDGRHVEVVKTIPYASNVLVMFLNGLHAVHGVTPRAVGPQPRLFVNLVGTVRRPLFDVGRHQERTGIVPVARRALSRLRSLAGRR